MATPDDVPDARARVFLERREEGAVLVLLLLTQSRRQLRQKASASLQHFTETQ